MPYSGKFKTTIKRHLEFEGGYSFHPQDPGGETYKGISRRYNADWSGWNLIDAVNGAPGFPGNLESNAALQSAVESHYHARYWTPMRLDEVRDQRVADEMFDIGAGPNGMSIAIKIAQGALILLGKDIELDGKMGPKTIETLNGYPYSADLVKLMNALQFCAFLFGSARVEEVKAMVKGRLPLLRQFLRGWLRRVEL